MAGAINELLLNQEQRSTLATNARRDAAQRFSLDRMVAETEELYAEVLAYGAQRVLAS
jgi:glycosyltransferase involved in cell wall biosynthesis